MAERDPLRSAPGYRPPRWLRGGHAQTIYPFFLPRRPVAYRRERLVTPDGDFVDFDWLDGPRDAPTVALFHGLEGNSRSHYALALAHQLQARGWRGVFPHFRGCSGEPNLLPRAYHSGDADEIGWMLREVHHRVEGTPLFAAGISLGGNALLKWLAREGSAAEQILERAAAVSAPVDLVAGGHAVDQGWSRVYVWHFLMTLKPKSFAKAQLFPEHFDLPAIRRAFTLKAFDNAVTAPMFGYRDAVDYWRRASSKPELADIAVPTLVLNAKNDPFLPAAALPHPHEVSPALTLEQPEEGGHVGFLTGPFPGRLDWLPRRLLEFFSLAPPEGDQPKAHP
ncbi:hypothetical protein BURK2_04176 [Burkholderiales bacterium]|nr:MAG: alpha/beta fold hydrolase [Burkholderiales bacterium]CAG1011089.1 hypothetical protein BURK2_04176 [Burkholderiales bacterium]